MYDETYYQLGKASNIIRQIFAYSLKRQAEIGKENVYDYSLGNPSVPTPQEVQDAIVEIVQTRPSLDVHGYTMSVGDASVRQTVADSLNRRFGTDIQAKNIYMATGAAGGLVMAMRGLYEDGDEGITFTPFFTEYTVYAETAGYKFIQVKSEEGTFQPDAKNLEAAITPKTKFVILNSPNNPSGAIYKKEKLIEVAEMMKRKEKEYGHPIFIISDEPYRELAYSGEVTFVPTLYDNTIVCYSFSKCFSMPGERIGYIVVPPSVTNSEEVFYAIAGAGRALGYICAPSLMQYVAQKCIDVMPDISPYIKNRELLYGSLTEMGYECIYPDGAFYLCMKALEDDAIAFCERAKKYEIMIVPGDEFAAPGYVRLAYCVDYDMIKRSLPAFQKLMDEYKK